MDNKKVFRDPVYNLIIFDKNEDQIILKLIDTVEVQRLKKIRQLGLSFFTYPSSVHDRFSHSLGVAYILGVIFDYLNIEFPSVEVKDVDGNYLLYKNEIKLILKIAGLLHDVGHGPFSHAFEKVTKFKHEEMSKKIIQNPNSQISKLLNDFTFKDVKAKGKLIQIISNILDGTFSIHWMKDLISSQIDADRIDYLLRDAYMCGVQYVSFDWQWILNNLSIKPIHQEENRLGIVIQLKKAIYSLESFIISRYHMYEQVYFHKTTRGAENLIHKIFERAKLLIEKEDKGLFLIDDNLTNFIGNQNNLNAFLNIDDYYMITQINIWAEKATDSILKELCSCYKERKLFKVLKEVTNDQICDGSDYIKIKEILGQDIYNNFFFIDNYINNPYKDDYLLGASNGAEHIWVEDEKGTQKELAEASMVLKPLRNSVTKKYRAYIHRDYEKQVRENVQCFKK